MVMGAPTWGSGTGVSGNTENVAKPKTSTSSSATTIIQASTGKNQVPQWLASELKSGAISSYSNPNTGQTFIYSRGAIHPTGSSAPAQITTSYVKSSTSSNNSPAANAVSPSATTTTSGNTGSLSSYEAQVAGEAAQAKSSGNPFSISAAEAAGYTVMPNAKAPGGYELIAGGNVYDIYGNALPKSLHAAGASSYASAWKSGGTIVQQSPAVDYQTFGTTAKITWVNSHSGTYYLTVNLPNGQTFQYGSASNPMQVYGVPLGTQEATNAAVDQAWQAYISGGTEALNSAGSGGSIAVGPGSGGYTLSITPGLSGMTAAPGTGYQSISLGNGYSERLPLSLMENNVEATGTWKDVDNSLKFSTESYTFANGANTITLQSPTAATLEQYGFSESEAEQVLGGLSGSVILSVAPNGQISATPAPGSTQTVKMPLGTINGQATTATIPVVYAYGSNGEATPVSFASGAGSSDTYAATINGVSYSFAINNGQIEYTQTGSAPLQIAASASGIAPAQGGATSPGSSLFGSNPIAVSGDYTKASGFSLSQADYSNLFTFEPPSTNRVPSALSGDYIIPSKLKVKNNPYTFQNSAASGITSNVLPAYAVSGEYTISSTNAKVNPNAVFFSSLGLMPPLNLEATLNNAKAQNPAEYYESLSSAGREVTSTNLSQDYLAYQAQQQAKATPLAEDLLIGGAVAGVALLTVATGGADLAVIFPEIGGADISSMLAWRGVAAGTSAVLTEAESYAATGKAATTSQVLENAGIAALSAGIGVSTGVLPAGTGAFGAELPISSMIGAYGKYAIEWAVPGAIYGGVSQSISNYGYNIYKYNGQEYQVPYGNMLLESNNKVVAVPANTTIIQSNGVEYAYDPNTQQFGRVLQPENIALQGATTGALSWANMGVEVGPEFDLVGRAIRTVTSPISTAIKSYAPSGIIARTAAKGAAKAAVSLSSGAFFAGMTAYQGGSPQQIAGSFVGGMFVPLGFATGARVGTDFSNLFTPPISTAGLKLGSIMVEESTPVKTGATYEIKVAQPTDILADFEKAAYVNGGTMPNSAAMPDLPASSTSPSYPNYASRGTYEIYNGYGGTYRIYPQEIASATAQAVPSYFTNAMVDKVASSIGLAATREAIGQEFLETIGGKAPVQEGVEYPERGIRVISQEGPEETANTKGSAVFTTNGGTTFYVDTEGNVRFSDISPQETASTAKITPKSLIAERTNIFGQVIRTALPIEVSEPLVTSTGIITPNGATGITINDYLNTKVGGLDVDAYMPNRLLSTANLLQISDNMLGGEYENTGPSIAKGGRILLITDVNPALPYSPPPESAALPSTSPTPWDFDINTNPTITPEEAERINNAFSTPKYTIELPQTVKDIYGTQETSAEPSAEAQTSMPKAESQSVASPTPHISAGAQAITSATASEVTSSIADSALKAVAFPMIDPNATIETHTGLGIRGLSLGQTPISSQYAILSEPLPHYSGSVTTFANQTINYLTELNGIAQLEEKEYTQNLSTYYTKLGKATGMSTTEIGNLVKKQASPFTKEIGNIEKAISTLIIETERLEQRKNVSQNDIIAIETGLEVLQRYLQELEAYDLAYANLQEFIPYQYNQQRLKNPEKSIVTQRALERALQKELQKELAITSPNVNVSVSGGTAPLPPQLNNSLTFMDMPRTGKIEYISQSKNEYHPSITAITFPEASAQSMFERAYLPEAKGIEVRPLIQPKVKAYA